MSMTKTEAESALVLWKQAYEDVASGKTFSHGGQTLTFNDADQIRNQINYLSRFIRGLAEQSATGRRNGFARARF